jgi:Zn finger protein HypA/HybF involved in hydrogenase expression
MRKLDNGTKTIRRNRKNSTGDNGMKRKKKSFVAICKENGGCGAKYYIKEEKAYLVCGFSEVGVGENKFYYCDKCQTAQEIK